MSALTPRETLADLLSSEFIQYDDSDQGHPTYPVMAQYGNNAYGYGSAGGYKDPSGGYTAGPYGYADPNKRMSMATSMGSAGTAGIAGVGGGARYANSSGHSNYDHSSTGDHGYPPDNGQQSSQWADYVNAYGAAPSNGPQDKGTSSDGHSLSVDQRLNQRYFISPLASRIYA